MYNFSGIIYRIWSTCGIMFLLAIILILLNKPWLKSFDIKKCKLAIILITMAICLTSIYISRIIFPSVSSYTGNFVESHRTSSSASPLPFNDKYVFWNGEDKKLVFYLDIFSKKEICPIGFEEGSVYTVHYDKLTNIIVAIEDQSDQSGDGSVIDN